MPTFPLQVCIENRMNSKGRLSVENSMEKDVMTQSEMHRETHSDRESITPGLAFMLFFFGGLTSVMIGVVWAGPAVLDIHTPAAGFLFSGLGSALVFALHRWRGLLGSLFVAVALAVVFGVMAGELFLSVFIHSLTVMSATAFVSEFMWGTTFHDLMFGKFTYMAIVLAAASLTATLILATINSMFMLSDLLIRNSAQGFLIGLGCGFGFEIAEYLGRKQKQIVHHKDTPVGGVTS